MGKNGNGKPDPGLLSMIGMVADMASHPANALGYMLVWMYSIVFQPVEVMMNGRPESDRKAVEEHKRKAKAAMLELLKAFDALSNAFHKGEGGGDDDWTEERAREHEKTCGCANAYSSYEIVRFAEFLASEAGQPLEGSKNSAFRGPLDPEQIYLAARKAQQIAVDPAVDDEFSRMLKDFDDGKAN